VLNQGVIFDGDDTLWRTEQLYDDARSRIRKIVSETGIDGSDWERLERKLDVENVATLGFGVDRFPTSCIQAYEELCHRSGTQIDALISSQVREAAVSPFKRDPAVVPGALETLISLRSQGVRLALLSKGVLKLQLRRIKASGLASYFDTIKIVTEKTPDVIRDVLSTLRVKPELAWMVGNSIRSDILPALTAGIHVIWIESHTWEYERALDHLVDSRVVVAQNVTEVPKLISRQV
jgi:putative hydrolase of the HAD superfamily